MGTISRTEEVSRLNDVEDSFEERYLKVRMTVFQILIFLMVYSHQGTNFYMFYE